MKIEVTNKLYTKQLLRSNPDKIFVFGDNMKKFGKGGQAIIRDEPNAFGIPTKRYPSKDDWAYFSDKEDEMTCVTDSLRELYKVGLSGKVIVFPCAGVGTGLAKLEEKSPSIWQQLCFILEKHFSYVN